MHQTLISLIIPFRNRASTLPRLLHSLEQVSYNPLEVILVDNSSTDESTRICRAFVREKGEQFQRCILITEEKPGASAARNAGLKEAQGEYIYFFDSDDELSPGFFDHCKPHFGAQLICASTLIVRRNGKIFKRSCTLPATPHVHIVEATLSTQSMLIQRSLIEEIGGWNETLPRWNDWELALRLLLQKPTQAYLRQAYHRINERTDTITGSSFSPDTEALIKAIEAASEAVEKAPALSEKERQLCRNALCGKSLLLAAKLRREGNQKGQHLVQNMSDLVRPTSAFKKLSRLLFFFDRGSVRGVWRLYAKLSDL